MFNFFDKLINYIYSKEGYYSLKSGLHIDHYVKNFFYKLHKNLNYYFGLLFLEKFFLNIFINNFFFKISTLNLKFIKLNKFLNFKSFKFLYLSLYFLLFFIVFFFFFL